MSDLTLEEIKAAVLDTLLQHVLTLSPVPTTPGDSDD